VTRMPTCWKVGNRRGMVNSGAALIVVAGLPGVGKTAVAAAVAKQLDAVHLSVDPVEDAMLSCGIPGGWNAGVAAYEAVRTMAEANLALGRVVVVDAVNDSDAARATWLQAAGNTGVPLVCAVLTCTDTDEHRRRLEGRSRRFTHVREPSWSQVASRSRNFAPWDGEHLLVDTNGISVADACAQICDYLAQ
jgi:predicted kinase